LFFYLFIPSFIYKYGGHSNGRGRGGDVWPKGHQADDETAPAVAGVPEAVGVVNTWRDCRHAKGCQCGEHMITSVCCVVTLPLEHLNITLNEYYFRRTLLEKSEDVYNKCACAKTLEAPWEKQEKAIE
jgi:hypothetical protein